MNFNVGDLVVYFKPKHSPSPSPRALDLRPQKMGEEYDYTIKKFWKVVDVSGEEVIVTTRRQKQIAVAKDDHRLRKARWWERLLYSERFPQKA